MKRLPIGIQSFKEIRTENYYYVDKTPFVKKLVETGKYFFLSRPRRFGKSLFVDTIKEAFSGSRELFKGLYLYNNWDWEKTYPIIKISFGSGVHRTSKDLCLKIDEFLLDIENDYNIKLQNPSISGKFFEAIKKLSEKYSEKVVVLIDEYDKPILDRIEDIDVAKENREILKDFYSVLKDADPYLKLVFLTGVSRFSKVSLFSGLNHLNDITLDERFSTICGYTQGDLESIFADRLKDFNMEEIKTWYNGYSWLGESVYNPFDILLLFDKKKFRPYWFETGTPTFLIKMFQKQRYYLPQLEGLEVGEQLLSNLDIDFIYPENLLFQAGYLTIKEFLRVGNENVYVLDYPNLEVKKSFTDAFLTYLTPNPGLKDRAEIGLIRSLIARDIERIREILYSFFSSIPYDWYRKNDLEEYEGFYASVIYALFVGAGLDVRAEDVTNLGRIDLTVIWENSVYIIEFKVVEELATNKALSQITEQRYYEKYKGRYSEIYLIGMEFSRKQRNIVSFAWEKMEV